MIPRQHQQPQGRHLNPPDLRLPQRQRISPLGGGLIVLGAMLVVVVAVVLFFVGLWLLKWLLYAALTQ